jgi:Uma2 family endonuclease
MAVATSSKKLTYEDYLLLPDDGGRRYEIIDGELFVTPSPIEKHQRVLANLVHHISSYVFVHRCGRLYFAPFDVVLSKHDIIEPDLLYVTKEHASRVTEKNVQGTPDFVIEILSDSTKRQDEVVKLQRYEHFGVAEYWIVDPKQDRVRVHLRKDGRLELAGDFGTDGTLTSSFFPGLAVPVRDVFADW